jgi:mRNA interferase RelE/StbE
MSVTPEGAPYLLQIFPKVVKQLAKLEIQEQHQIWQALLTLCAEGHGDLKAMQGEFKGATRLRSGKLRLIFVQEGSTLIVLRLGRRKDIYE